MQTQTVTHVPLTVPQMGEGLVEVRIVTFLKHAGDAVRRDEPLLEVETDKAVLAIESPVDGVIEKWEAEEGESLPIGAVIGGILCASAVPFKNETAPVLGTYQAQALPSAMTQEKHWHKEKNTDAPPSAPADWNRNRAFSPRVRLYCEGHGVSADEMLQIERADAETPLRIADVERWLRARTNTLYRDRTLSPRQQQMTFRLKRAGHETIPAAAEIECDWDALQTARERYEQQKGERVSLLELISFCVVRALKNHPRFRSTLIGEHTLREYKQVNLGVAVGLPDDEITTATLPDAGAYEFGAFVESLRGAIQRARNYDAGREERHDAMQLIITKLSGRQIYHAVPVVVPPAAATLFIGAPYEKPQRCVDDLIRWQKVATLVLTFDHRFINGMGAADFLEEIQSHIAQLAENPIPGPSP